MAVAGEGKLIVNMYSFWLVLFVALGHSLAPVSRRLD